MYSEVYNINRNEIQEWHKGWEGEILSILLFLNYS